MMSVGWCNLKRDPARLAVAVLGVVFSVVLVTVEVGMLTGMLRNASLLIDTSKADLWVSSPNVKTFDFAPPFNLRKKDRIGAVTGVERVEEYSVSYSACKLANGAEINIEVIGFDERGALAPQLNLVEGRLDDIHNQDAIILDEADKAKLGNVKLNDTLEILNHRARIVGFTRGMRAFTTTPYVFTSIRSSHRYSFRADADSAIYLLVKTAPGANVFSVRDAIRAGVSEIDVHTSAEFSWKTRSYWLVQTGIGLAFLGAAFLGLLVGGAIVSQTLYAMTLEKLPEFGVLKALGATMYEISSVVLHQGFICGSAGLVLGLLVSFAISAAATQAGTSVEITASLVGAVIAITAGLCAGAALVSIQRLRRLEPAAVFRT
jgi:putative ABC transport system permease protein